MLFLLLRWRPKVEPDTMISHDLVIAKQLQKKILAMPSVEVFRVSARSGSKKIWSNFSSDRFSALRVSWALTAGGPTSWASRSSPPSYRWASCPSARSRPDTCSSRDRGSKTQETVRLGFEPPAVSCQPAASQPANRQSVFSLILQKQPSSGMVSHIRVKCYLVCLSQHWTAN